MFRPWGTGRRGESADRVRNPTRAAIGAAPRTPARGLRWPAFEGADDAAWGVVEADADGSVQGQKFAADVESGGRALVPPDNCIRGRDSHSARQRHRGQPGWHRKARGGPARCPDTESPRAALTAMAMRSMSAGSEPAFRYRPRLIAATRPPSRRRYKVCLLRPALRAWA